MLIFFLLDGVELDGVDLDGVELDGVPPTFARAGAKNSQNGVFRRIWAREVSFDLILRGGARGDAWGSVPGSLCGQGGACCTHPSYFLLDCEK